MGKQVKFTVKREIVEAALREFHLNYAPAMQEWSRLERSLCDWFQLATGMQNSMANGIFYSARGFTARIEMFEATLEHTVNLSALQIEFLQEAAKRARQYIGFRNKIAHGEPRPDFTLGEPPRVSYVIAQGRDSAGQGDVLSIEDLRLGATRIKLLHTCISEMHPWLRARNPNLRSPEECLLQVRALPIEPNDKSAHSGVGSTQSTEAPVHRNKREYRAQQAAKKQQGEQ